MDPSNLTGLTPAEAEQVQKARLREPAYLLQVLESALVEGSKNTKIPREVLDFLRRAEGKLRNSKEADSVLREESPEEILKALEDE